MIKKILAIMIAVISCFVLSVSAFAVSPNFDNSVVGSQSLAVSECQQWLVDNSGSSDIWSTVLTMEIVENDYTWIAVGGTNVVTASLVVSDVGQGFQFWYDESGTFTVDMYSGDNVTRIAGNATPVEPDSPPSNVSSVIKDVNTAAGGIFDISSKAFTFMLSNPLCFLMLGAGFCFTAMGLARKALRASKKS